MALLDLAAITGRAAWVRARAGVAGTDPPYHTHDLIAAAFPAVSVAGADLPAGVLEMAEVGAGGRRVLWYARAASHDMQRVALAHGLHHFMSDLRRRRGMRECNIGLRGLEHAGAVAPSPVERACDLFAGELLVPFAVLDRYVTPVVLSSAPAERDARRDRVDALASLFNVPRPFMEWRLHDLALLRRTHFYVG